MRDGRRRARGMERALKDPARTMPHLVVVGLGYSATRFVAEVSARFDRVTATVRDPARAGALARTGFAGRPVEAIAYDGRAPSPALAAALAGADALLVSAPPDETGDPVLRHHADDIARASRLGWIGYLSTVGVYGDHRGGWVDETTPCQPVSARSHERLAAETAWAALAARSGKPATSFRLSGIYGPGSNALVNLRAGTAKRIVKPGQVFNRIHVDDIAGALAASLARPEVSGIVNVTDDEPAPPQDVVVFAANLLGIAPPPEIAWDDARPRLSPMAISFYGEVKRVRNARLRNELGYALRHPTYREGIAACFAAGDGRD